MAVMLHGNGRSTASTVGELGQYYKDDVTGDLYECRVASEYSPLHGSPIPGYRWEKRVTGEDVREHRILDGSVDVLFLYSHEGMICDKTYDEVAEGFSDMVKLHGFLEINQSVTGGMESGLMSSIAVYRNMQFGGGKKNSINFVFMETTGKLVTYRLYSDNTLEEIKA